MTADVESDVVNTAVDDHSLSPVERIGIVLSDWLKDHPSRRGKGADPIERGCRLRRRRCPCL